MIRETSLPVRHEGSRIELTPQSAGTEVVWTARFTVSVPIIGKLVGSWLDRRLSEAFADLLRGAKQKFEAR